MNNETIIINADRPQPTEETRRFVKLIGKALTEIRFTPDGVVLEFDIHGKITIMTMLDCNCSVTKDFQ